MHYLYRLLVAITVILLVTSVLPEKCFSSVDNDIGVNYSPRAYHIKRNNRLNENIQMLDIEYKKLHVLTFINSYRKRSYAIATPLYSKKMLDQGAFKAGLSLNIGLVRGYGERYWNFKGITPFGSASAYFSYSIDDRYTAITRLIYTPSFNGGVIAPNIGVSWQFD